MSEFSAPQPTEQEINAGKLASLRASQEIQAPAEESEQPQLTLIKGEGAPALPQRKPLNQEANTQTPSEPEVPGIYTSGAQHTEHISPENPGAAADALDSLRASGLAGLAEPIASVENEDPSEYVGKRVDTTVELDALSRATESASDSEGKHVSEVELTPDSEVQTGGKHLDTQQIEGTHVSEVELTSDSETQTGGKHLVESDASNVLEVVQTIEQPTIETTVEAPIAPVEKRRKFGSILRLLKRQK